MDKSKNNNIILYKPLPKSKRFKLYIPYALNHERKLLKALNSSFYHPHQKLWSLINTDENWAIVIELFKGKISVTENEPRVSLPKVILNEASLNAIAETEKIMTLKAFARSTVTTYKSELVHFFKYFEKKPVEQISKTEIENYIYFMIKRFKISKTKQNQIINAIKCYFEHVLGKDRTLYTIQRPKKDLKLPNVLSKDDISKLLGSIENLKHKTILTTIYSAGLRISELSNLRIEDIDSSQGIIFIKAAKGKKDRHSILSPVLLNLLRIYYKKYRPSYWLFEGQTGGKYSSSSIQKILRKAVKVSNVNAWTTAHTLRHSFATHLMQSGVNMRIIQNLLGHSSSKTTEIYTHVLNINNKVVQSPLDNLAFNINFKDSKVNNH